MKPTNIDPPEKPATKFKLDWFTPLQPAALMIFGIVITNTQPTTVAGAIYQTILASLAIYVAFFTLHTAVRREEFRRGETEADTPTAGTCSHTHAPAKATCGVCGKTFCKRCWCFCEPPHEKGQP